MHRKSAVLNHLPTEEEEKPFLFSVLNDLVTDKWRAGELTTGRDFILCSKKKIETFQNFLNSSISEEDLSFSSTPSVVCATLSEGSIDI